MEKVNYKNEKKVMLVYIFFIIITFCKGIGLSGSNIIYIFAYAIGTFFIALKMLNDSFNKKELFAVLSLVIIGLLDFFIGNTTTVLFTAISLCCLKNINRNNILKIMLWVRIFSFTLMIILSLTGVINNDYILHYRAETGFIKRYCFGYSHPNLAHSTFSIIIFLFGYIYYKKINFFTITFLEIINFILYNFTLSRTGFIILTLYLILLYLFKKIKIIRKIIPKVLKFALLFFIIISIVLAYTYTTSELVKKLDVLLTGRLNYMNILIRNYSIPIIGSDSYNEIVLFDNGYFSMFYEGGLLATIWFVYYLTKTNNFLIKNNKDKEMLLMLFFLFYCMFESYFMNILMNPTLIFICDYIFKEKKENEKVYLESTSDTIKNNIICKN